MPRPDSSSTASKRGKAFGILLALFYAATTAHAQNQPLEILVLGSGGPGAVGRASSCYLVFIDGVARLLVDAGSGAFVRLGEAKASLAKTDLVLLTHLHIDHTAELPGLFKARAVASSGPIAFDAWGPSGAPARHDAAYFPATSRFLRLLFGPTGAWAYLSDFAAPMTLHAHDIAAGAGAPQLPHVIITEGDLVVTAVAGHHGDAPAVIYRIDHGGKSVTFSGDIEAAGLAALRNIAKASDLLIFNTVVLDPPGSPAVLYSLHTPPNAIGQAAKDAGVHALLLSHLSPATDDKHEAVLSSIRQNYAGNVTFAKDGLRVTP